MTNSSNPMGPPRKKKDRVEGQGIDVWVHRQAAEKFIRREKNKQTKGPRMDDGPDKEYRKKSGG